MQNFVETLRSAQDSGDNELGYLLLNPDVAMAGVDASKHRRDFGISEGRREFVESSCAEISALREEKFVFLQNILKPYSAHEFSKTYFNKFPMNYYIANDDLLPIEQIEVGINDYDSGLENLLDQNPTENWVDVGAGLRSKYRKNVTYCEISSLPTTDVVCFGENLPFRDESFDGVICLAVLEHVKDPQIVFNELIRVLKPGGQIIIDWPFLQPYHGHPFHFFNATREGVRETAVKNGRIENFEISVPSWLHPIHGLHWVLKSWAKSLPSDLVDDFHSLKISDFLSQDPYDLLSKECLSSLDPETLSELAAGHRLVGKKTGSPQ